MLLSLLPLAGQAGELQILSIEFIAADVPDAKPAPTAPAARGNRMSLSGHRTPIQSITGQPDVAVPARSGETVSFRTSEPASPKLQNLENLPRLVIDLPTFRWKVPPEQVKHYHGQLIRQLRYARNSASTSRIVLDLQQPARGEWLTRGPATEHRIRLIPTGVASAMPAPVPVPNPPKPSSPTAQLPTPVSTLPSSPPPSPKVARAEAYPVPRLKPQPGQSIASAPSPSVMPSVPAANPVPAAPTKKTIVIDAGHGGQDPGAIGPTGVQEKAINLAFARTLKERLEATGRYKAVLTRDRDFFIPLRQRVNIARAAKGDLFVSLHSDSAPGAQARGLSLYSLSETASDAETAKLAAKENKADIINGVDLSGASQDVTDILLDLTQRSTMARSESLGRALLTGIRQQGVVTIQKPHRYAGFAVLKAPDIPSVLVELGFVSHPEEEHLLQEPAHRTQIADGLVKGIDSYFAAVTTKP